MPRNISQIRRLGTCRVNFQPAGGGAPARLANDMGYTLGGVTVTITMDQVEINVDDYGTVPVDSIDVGTNIEAVTPLIQATLANYSDTLWPGTNSPLDRLTFGRIVGTSITKGRLVLDPINDTDGIVIYSAGCISIDDLGYNNDGVRIIGAHWKGFVDDNRNNGDKVFRIFGTMS